MLVLSRQKDESIIIGDDVEVIIVDVRGDKVRLGITAPKNITVHRREVYEAIQREKKEKETRESEVKQEPQKEDKAKKEAKEEKKRAKKDKEQ
jgi:carbon storage regulator